MEINVENMKQLMSKYENKIFPTILGDDGQGIERFRAVVEKKRNEVEKRKTSRVKLIDSIK